MYLNGTFTFLWTSVNISDYYKIKPFLCVGQSFFYSYSSFSSSSFSFLLLPHPLPHAFLFFLFDDVCTLCPMPKINKQINKQTNKQKLFYLNQRLKEIKSKQLILTTSRTYVWKFYIRGNEWKFLELCKVWLRFREKYLFIYFWKNI